MSEFGTAFRKPGTERNGVVIDSIDGGQVAGVIYASHHDNLYLIPRSILSEIDRTLIRSMSKSQRARLYQNFSIGENVDFEANKNGVVTWICKSAPVREMNLAPDGHFVFSTVGVLSNKLERHFWTKDCGCVTAAAKRLVGVLPNVALNCTVALKLNYGEHEGQMEFFLATFRPKFSFFLHSISGVSLDFDVLYHAPWNKTKFMPSSRVRTSSTGEVENIFTASYGDIKMQRCIRCVAISLSELYSQRYTGKLIRVGYHPRGDEDENRFEVGALLSVNLYECPINDCPIVNAFMRHGDTLHVKKDDYWGYKFLTVLEWTPAFYQNDVFDAVFDEYQLLNGRSPDGVKTWVAPRYGDGDAVDFIIVQAGNQKAQIRELLKSNSINQLAVDFASTSLSERSPERSEADVLAELHSVDREILREMGRYSYTFDFLQKYGLIDDFMAVWTQL